MKLQSLEALSAEVAGRRAAGQRVVFTNGCFDILHAGHVTLLAQARALGDYLVVGINSDASVRRLKGERRPIHPQMARATVLSALEAVDAVVIFEEDTPVPALELLRPSIHAKGGDYIVEQLPETPTVQKHGGEVHILPLVDGFSTSLAEQKLGEAKNAETLRPRVLVMIPARFGSTRFPGKPLVDLGGETVITRVVRAALQSQAERPVVVATDDDRIADEVRRHFSDAEAVPVMTSEACHTGTDRLAEATLGHLGAPEGRVIIINVQGDEPFLDARHLDVLVERMLREPELQMATLATPIVDQNQHQDPNVVKAVVNGRGHALYFSRATIPFQRDGAQPQRLRHLGIYAYDARWLLQMASLPPTALEDTEKLEQLRALDHGVQIGVEVVENVVPIAIDTPEDLQRAVEYLAARSA